MEEKRRKEEEKQLEKDAKKGGGKLATSPVRVYLSLAAVYLFRHSSLALCQLFESNLACEYDLRLDRPVVQCRTRSARSTHRLPRSPRWLPAAAPLVRSTPYISIDLPSDRVDDAINTSLSLTLVSLQLRPQ
jgi:hypothetical protein